MFRLRRPGRKGCTYLYEQVRVDMVGLTEGGGFTHPPCPRTIIELVDSEKSSRLRTISQCARKGTPRRSSLTLMVYKGVEGGGGDISLRVGDPRGLEEAGAPSRSPVAEMRAFQGHRMPPPSSAYSQ